MKLSFWVADFDADRMTETIVEVPDDEWDAMTEPQREEYKRTLFENTVVETVGGGHEAPEV